MCEQPQGACQLGMGALAAPDWWADPQPASAPGRGLSVAEWGTCRGLIEPPFVTTFPTPSPSPYFAGAQLSLSGIPPRLVFFGLDPSPPLPRAALDVGLGGPGPGSLGAS